jgi:hypothetical protein
MDASEPTKMGRHVSKENLATSLPASSVDRFPLLQTTSSMSGGVGNPIYVWNFQKKVIF